jgi:hypothetical protein
MGKQIKKKGPAAARNQNEQTKRSVSFSISRKESANIAAGQWNSAELPSCPQREITKSQSREAAQTPSISLPHVANVTAKKAT